MRFADNRLVTGPTRLGIFVPMGLTAIWILSSRLPMLGPYFYATRWQVTVLLGAISILYLAIRGFGKLTTAHWSLLFLCGLALLSETYTFVPRYTVLRAFALCALLSAAFFAVYSMIRTADDVKRSFAVLWYFYAIASIIILMSQPLDIAAMGTEERFQGNRYLKATGVASTAASFGPFLFWARKYFRYAYRPLVIGLAFLLVLVVFLTKSKAGVGMVLLIWPVSYAVLTGKRINRGMLMLVIVTASFAVAVYSSSDVRNALRLGHDIDEFTTGRYGRWQTLLEMGRDRPLLGHGFGTSRYIAWYERRSGRDLPWDLSLNDRQTQIIAHNEHVGLFFDLGLVGLIGFWSIILHILNRGVAMCRAPPTALNGMLCAIFFSWCCHLLNTFAHDGNLTAGNPNAYLFWSQAAIVIAGFGVARSSWVRGDRAYHETSLAKPR